MRLFILSLIFFRGIFSAVENSKLKGVVFSDTSRSGVLERREPGTYTAAVRTTDMFNQSWQAHRIIRVK